MHATMSNKSTFFVDNKKTSIFIEIKRIVFRTSQVFSETVITMLFEAAFEIDANLLMRIQLNYNMRMAKQDKSFAERLVEIRKISFIVIKRA
jgi:plasmid maintenance system antidote protein VapI